MGIKSVFASVVELKRALQNLSVEALETRLTDEKLLLVDLREMQEQVDQGTIPGSRLVPRGMLEFWADPASPYYRDFFTEDRSIVVFCAHGQRSALGAKALLDLGYRDVAHLEHGFHGWTKAGRPIQDVASRSRWMRKPKPGSDPRPTVCAGHITMHVPDVAPSKAFFVTLGMRDVGVVEGVQTLEMRGGTHLQLVPGEPSATEAPFDLMVDDVEQAHAAWQAAGIEVGDIETRDAHWCFSVVEPGGHRIVVNSSHASGQPV